MTQQQLAEQVEISRNYLSEIERGGKNPSGLVASRIALILNFDMSLFYKQEAAWNNKADSA